MLFIDKRCDVNERESKISMKFFQNKKQVFLLSLFVFLSLLSAGVLFAQEESVQETSEGQKKLEAEDLPVEVVADSLQYAKEEKKIIAQGNVLVIYKGMKLQADQAEVYTDTKVAHAQGHVTVFEGASTISGEKTDYDFEHYKGSFPQGTVYQDPWYGYSETVEQVSKNRINTTKTSVTTCDLERPHYELCSKNVTVYPDDKIVLRNVTFRVLGKPYFWLPYLTIPIDKNHALFEARTGYSDNFGFYFLAAKEMSLSKNVKIKPHVDFRSKRGVAYGLDSMYWIPNFGRGKIITYLTSDKRAPHQVEDGENLVRNRSRETRYRFSIRHRTDFDPDTNVIVNWHELSDEWLLQEFFQREDRREARPRSQVVATHVKNDYAFFTEVVKRTNRFWPEIEKLPRVHFTWKNQPLFDTNLLYKHETEFANFQRFRSIGGTNNTNTVSNEGEDTVRFYTNHAFQYPFRIFDGRVKVTPYGGGQVAYYTKGRDSRKGMSRFLMNAGIETRTRYQKTFDTSMNFLGIDINKLRHIVEPVARYDSIPIDTTDHNKFYQMDSVDAMHRHDIVRFGFENRLQTKRHPDGDQSVWQRVDVVSYSTYLNYEFGDGRDGGSTMTDWENKASLRPYDWLTLQGRAIFDFTLQDFREVFYDVVLNPKNERVRLVLSQGYFSHDPQYGDTSRTNVIAFDSTIKLNERWKIGGYARAELQTKKVEEWEVRFIRDLHDFILTFGANVRNSKFQEGANTEFFVSLRMVAFPEVAFDVGNRSTLPDPRVGHYYDGSIDEKQMPALETGAY